MRVGLLEALQLSFSFPLEAVEGPSCPEEVGAEVQTQAEVEVLAVQAGEVGLEVREVLLSAGHSPARLYDRRY